MTRVGSQRHKKKIYIYMFIFRVIKSRRMRWAGHVARMGDSRGYRGFCGET